MRYVKVKSIVDEISTKQIKGDGNVNVFNYYGKTPDGFEHYGVNTDEAGLDNFLAAQDDEIEAQEETYEDVLPVLQTSFSMIEFNRIIEREIAKRYSVGKEFKMRDLSGDDPERIEYEEYKSAIKERINLLKKEAGLIQ